MAIRSGKRRPARRVGVLLGGPSAERDISLKSGAAVAQALAEAGHQVVEIDPAQVDPAGFDWSEIDVAFIALHGRFGEDGQVQQILEEAGVPYTGSGVLASRTAFSKSAAKERFLQEGVPTPRYVLVHESDTAHHILTQAEALGFPLAIKPDAQGSSLGVSIVESADGLPAALARCFDYGPFGLLEAAIVGSEWTVGLLDDEAFSPIRIETARSFFDYRAKYEDDGTRYLFDHGVPPEVGECVSQTARRACQAVGTRGMARVDLMLDRAANPWVLEVNTVPGLTDHSLVPKAALHDGSDFIELCQRCIDSALAHASAERHRQPRRKSA